MWTNQLLNKDDNEEKLSLQIVGSIIPRLIGIKKIEGQEKPDYQGVDIGVEITRAMEHTGEVSNFVNKFNNRKYSQLPKKRLRKMGFDESPYITNSKGNIYIQRSKKNGFLWYIKPYDNSDLILIAGGFSGMNTEEDIISSVMRKIKKLNTDYKRFSENDLIVLVGEQINYSYFNQMIRKQVLNKIISSLKVEFEKKEYEYYFDNLFILFLDFLCEISTETWEYKDYDISQQMLDYYKALR